MDFGENISRAIAFLFHLKAHLRFVFSEENVDCAPQQLGIGGGIHVGKVAFAKELKDKRSVIDHLEGFAINYAKRIESCSRSGKYSRVFLSKEAVGFLKDAPILFSNSVEPLKGIEDKAEVYEVQSGLLEMKFDEQDFGDKQLIREAKRLAKSPKDIDEAWIKSFIVSVLDLLHRNALMINIQKDYYKKQLEFAWRDPIEDDPILLYIRARDFSIKKEFTQQMRYLKVILDKHPKFIHAKKRLIEACWQIAKGKSEPAELIYTRDMAKEFMECYPYLLTDGDKGQFQAIIDEVNKNAKRKCRNFIKS
jgi:hypothetical protein